MKFKSLLPVLTIGALAMTACQQQATQTVQTDLTQYVDQYIGSGEHGHVFVGANVPFGMVQVGPQNIYKGWDWCSGYHYSDSILIGFSHTHLSGTGCADLGDILIMPYTGQIRTARGEQDNIEGSASIYYTHDQEEMAPGYYAISMSNGVKAEMTATERVGLHRYSFPKGEEQHVLVNLLEGIGSTAVGTHIEKVDENTLTGYRYSRGWSPNRKTFFVIKTDQPIESMLVYENDEPKGNDNITTEIKRPEPGQRPVINGAKSVLTFKNSPEQVQMKVAISSVSTENAIQNLEAEAPAWNFDEVRAQATDKWNKQLAMITIDTDSPQEKTIFYTSMFHLCICPQLYCDVNGEYRGLDDQIHKAQGNNYSCFSTWDTYRTLNPLFTIIKTDMVNDIANSFLATFDEQGKMPIWTLQAGETECMPGYSSVPILIDAYLKGFNGFDAERAYKAVTTTANFEKQKAIPEFKKYGFIPADLFREATSIALEYAADDWGIALMAKQMGKTADYEEYMKRGRAYETYYDKNIGFARPKLADGSWRTPYEPAKQSNIGDYRDWCEGNGWQYTFFNPQCPEMMIDLMGGDEAFTSKLDSLFVAEGDLGENASPDVSGLIGQYAHGNEPSHPFCYYYPYAGQQWKTAKHVRYIMSDFYTDKPEGVIGNEDCGQMSAWYIMSALGFYQVNPSNGVFVFGSPAFNNATVQLPQGKTLKVVAQGNSKENIYIQSVELNGKPYEKAYITYEDIMKGGELKFVMGATPNKDFGTAKENRPVSAM